MILKIIKKFIVVFLILSLSIINFLGYFYDSLFPAFDLSHSNNTSFINYSKKDFKLINELSHIYDYNDWSKTSITIKWIKLSSSKIDFITNYKWFFSDLGDSSKNKILISRVKNDNSPKEAFILTNLSLNKFFKEKIDVYKLFESIAFLKKVNLNNSNLTYFFKEKVNVLYSGRAPPLYYILTMI
jgi:hypothetical protein